MFLFMKKKNFITFIEIFSSRVFLIILCLNRTEFLYLHALSKVNIMTNYSEVQDVIIFMKQRFISISEAWVDACISFLKQEHAGQNLTPNRLKEFVYQQWLIADLEEICVPSLPRELATTQKTTLNGSFALQVNYVRDVGKPAYAQLKELDRQTNSNAEFSAAARDVSIPPWEAKPTRMLMLNLTDGCSTVQGMEYKQISFLSQTLTPGIKVLIQGPVDCRFGVFLLTPEKIKVLGGEVESKLEQYSQKSVLREILNLPVPDNEASDEHIPDENDPIQQIDDPDELNSVSIISNNSNYQSLTTPSSFRQPTIPTSSPISSNAQSRNSNYSSTSARQNRGTSNRIDNYFSNQHQTERQSRNAENDLDDFENDDDDFAQSLDYGAIDELERENSTTQIEPFEDLPDTEDIWNEDEDVLQDMMAFQDENPCFDFPSENSANNQNRKKEESSGNEKKLPFTYLSSVPTEIFSDTLVTVKGFIIKVLSKLECTLDKGWNLCVKINDGTATVDASIYDKALESIIGISAAEMVKMQKQAAQDQGKRKEVMEGISKCKTTLQDYNCLMDIKFSPNTQPCIMKFYQFSELHTNQLFQRVKSCF